MTKDFEMTNRRQVVLEPMSLILSTGQALAWALVTKVAEDGRALEKAWKMARELAEDSLHSFGWCKQQTR